MLQVALQKMRKRQRYMGSSSSSSSSATLACTADVAKSDERVPVSRPGFLPTLTTNSVIAFVGAPSTPQQVWASGLGPWGLSGPAGDVLLIAKLLVVAVLVLALY